MKSIGDLSKKHNIKELTRHPRLKMLDEFVKRVNAERVAQDMRPLPVSAIAVKTSHLSIEDMSFLLKRCSQSSNFSRTFFGSLKIAKSE